MTVVGIFQDQNHILDALLDQPVGDNLAHNRAGRRGAEDIINAVVDARRIALEAVITCGADEVVARVGVNRRDAILFHHAHRRQTHSAVIKADDAAYAILQDQPLHHQLSVFRDAFRIASDQV